MSDIHKARQELVDLANELENNGDEDSANDIRNIVQNHMFRRSPARRAPVRSRPITERVKQRIIDMAETTDLHSAEIAVRLNINPGRVSEVLQGDR